MGHMIYYLARYLNLGCPLPQHQYGKWGVYNYFVILIRVELLILRFAETHLCLADIVIDFC